MSNGHPPPAVWSRRAMLRGSAAALMGGYGLAPRYGLAADIPSEYDGSKFQMAAPEPNAKSGGVMRYVSRASKCRRGRRVRCMAPTLRTAS